MDLLQIFYIVAPSRQAALNSPYYETFLKHKQEVLFLYNAVDDFVMGNIKTYGGRTLVSAETSTVDLDSKSKDDKADEKDEAQSKAELSEDQSKEVCNWLLTNLGNTRVRDVSRPYQIDRFPCGLYS